jgi:hypothetical protein
MKAISVEETAAPILNWARVLFSGLVSAFILFIGDAILNGALLGRAWEAAAQAFGTSSQRTLGGLAIFILLDVLKGIAIMWLYSVNRLRRNSVVKAVITASIGFWFMNAVLPWMMFVPLGFFPRFLIIMVPLLSLIPIFLAAFLGSYFYRD